MVTDKNYTFSTSISVGNYFSKAECTTSIAGTREQRKELGISLKIGFKEQTVTAKDLLDYSLNGHTFCNLFEGYSNTYNQTFLRKTDNAFTMSAKQDNFFKGSYTVSVDIDEVSNYDSASDLISDLTNKPTFWNTTYNHLQPNKGIRIRLVYVFDQMITGNDYGWFYRYVSSNVVNSIIKDTNEVVDECSLRASQYYNGTNKNNPELNVEYGITNNIYSLEDFGVNEYNFYLFLLNDNTKVKKDKKVKKEELIKKSTTYYNDLQKSATPRKEEKEAINSVIFYTDPVDQNLISDMSRLDYDEFMKYNRHKYNYFYRVEHYNWIDAGEYSWAYIDENYFSLYWNVSTVKDGFKRRKKVFERMCLRRLIDPCVDADTLAFCAYEDIHRFFDNSDGLLGAEYIERNIERCFSMSLEEIEETYSDNIAYLRSLAPKKGKIYKFKNVSVSDRNSYISDVTMNEVMSYYNYDLTINENLDYLSGWGIKVSQKTLYNYLHKMGLSNKKSIDKKKEDKEDYIKSLINDDNCSNRKFREVLNEKNIKLSDKKLREYIKEYKDKKEEEQNSTTYYNDLQFSATPIFEENSGINYVFSTGSGNNDFNTTSIDYNELEKKGMEYFLTNGNTNNYLLI